MRTDAWLTGLLCVLCGVLCMVAGTARAVSVWMPQTGEVELEELDPDDPEARREHAYALIGTGQWAGGIAELRDLVQRHPDAEWVPEARMLIARALLSRGSHEEAFEELAELASAYPDTPVASEARELQLEAARRRTRQSLKAGFELYDRLEKSAPDTYEAADLARRKADAALAAGHFLEAEDQYLALVSFYPRSEWVPYCWYRIAECQWKRAERLAVGPAGFREAQRAFTDFTESFPRHSKAAEARQKAEQVREQRAELNVRIARFYIEARGRPWAAVNYLRYLKDEFPGSPQAEWAEKKLHGVKQQLRRPLAGRMRSVGLPGVRTEDSSR